ncbi:MAG: hypothetical protein JSV20_04745 [Candidatus Bathyarchaeota archaeon]|nr:MAG: hypothetical protein JSV20_04745 [Candidatus Bathyarchaeota archaeon]
MKRKYNQLIDIYRGKTQLTLHVSHLFCSIMSTRAADISSFFSHCKSIASLLIKEGVATNVTSSILRKRQILGLPPLEINKTDFKKIADLTGLTKKIKGIS